MSVTWHMTIKYPQNPLLKATSNGDYGNWFTKHGSPTGSPQGSPAGTIRKVGTMAPNTQQGGVSSKPNYSTHAHAFTHAYDPSAHKILPAEHNQGKIYSFTSRVSTNGEVLSNGVSEPTVNGVSGKATVVTRRPSETPRNSPEPERSLYLNQTSMPLKSISQNGAYPSTVDMYGGSDQKSPRGYPTMRPYVLERSSTIHDDLDTYKKTDRRDFADLSLRRSRSFHETGISGPQWKQNNENSYNNMFNDVPRAAYAGSLGRVQSRYMLPSVPNSNVVQGNKMVETISEGTQHVKQRPPMYWLYGSRGGGSVLSDSPSNDNVQENNNNNQYNKTLQGNDITGSKMSYSPNGYGTTHGGQEGGAKVTMINVNFQKRADDKDDLYQTRNALSPRSKANESHLTVATTPSVNGYSPKLIPTFPSHTTVTAANELVNNYVNLPQPRSAPMPSRPARVTKSILKKTSAYGGQNKYETICHPITWGHYTSKSTVPLDKTLPTLGGQYRYQNNQQSPTQEDQKKNGSGKKVTFAL